MIVVIIKNPYKGLQHIQAKASMMKWIIVPQTTHNRKTAIVNLFPTQHVSSGSIDIKLENGAKNMK